MHLPIAPSLVKNEFQLAERCSRKARLLFAGSSAASALATGAIHDLASTKDQVQIGKCLPKSAVAPCECDEVLATVVHRILEQTAPARRARIVLAGEAQETLGCALAGETTLVFDTATGKLGGEAASAAAATGDTLSFDALAIIGVLDRLDLVAASRLLDAARAALNEGGKLICFGPTQRHRGAPTRHHSPQIANAAFTVIYKEISMRASLPSELVIGIRPGSGNELDL